MAGFRMPGQAFKRCAVGCAAAGRLVEAEPHAAGECPRCLETRRKGRLCGVRTASIRHCSGPHLTQMTRSKGPRQHIMHSCTARSAELTVTSVEKPRNALGTLLVLTCMTKSCKNSTCRLSLPVMQVRARNRTAWSSGWRLHPKMHICDAAIFGRLFAS